MCYTYILESTQEPAVRCIGRLHVGSKIIGNFKCGFQVNNSYVSLATSIGYTF